MPLFSTIYLLRRLSANTFHECRERGPYLNWRIFLQIVDALYCHHLLVWPRSGKFATPPGNQDSAWFADNEKLGEGGLGQPFPISLNYRDNIWWLLGEVGAEADCGATVTGLDGSFLSSIAQPV